MGPTADPAARLDAADLDEEMADGMDSPEIAAQRNAIKEWVRGGHSLDLFFSLHNTETGEYLEGPPEGFRPAAGSWSGRCRA